MQVLGAVLGLLLHAPHRPLLVAHAARVAPEAVVLRALVVQVATRVGAAEVETRDAAVRVEGTERLFYVLQGGRRLALGRVVLAGDIALASREDAVHRLLLVESRP